MALVPYLEQANFYPTSHPFYAAVMAVGKVLNLHKALAHVPRALEAYATLNQAMVEMRLSPRLREIAYIRVTGVNQCLM